MSPHERTLNTIENDGIIHVLDLNTMFCQLPMGAAYRLYVTLKTRAKESRMDQIMEFNCLIVP